MKIGDLVRYKSPISIMEESILGLVVDVNMEKGWATISWVDNNQKDVLPTKWLEIIVPSKPDSLGLVVEVKGKIHGANHDWNKYYYMVQIVGTKYPTPIWNENLELVRKVK